MPFLVNSKANIAAEIYDQIKVKIGLMKATSWMLTAHDGLEGQSPIQAIKAGNAQQVRKLADGIS